MRSNPKIDIKEADLNDFTSLKKVGMTTYDQSIDPQKEFWLVRLLFLRYFSKRKFKQRQQAGVQIVAAWCEKQIVGFYELENGGLLSSLYVLPSYQGQGYGKALLDHAFESARVIGLKEIHLDSSRNAQAFYEHYGFKQSQKSRLVLGIVMIPMKMMVQ